MKHGGTILGIESSCDETAASVVLGGRRILSSIVHSQASEHAVFGGVVPEIAGRSHLRTILPVVEAALHEADCNLDTIDGIAVTSRPGLIGSLLIGLSVAKALSYERGLPLIGVHHIEAHAYAATMEHDVALPAVALIVSGGHTALYRMETTTVLHPLASTLDDAAGEAFDKVAHMLGLSYPGGPSVSALALEGDPTAFAFPRYRAKDGGVGFSFSGLKTAVLYHLRGQDALAPTPAPEEIPRKADVAASFQEAVVDTLVRQTLQAAAEEELTTIVVAGGVACNARLRKKMTSAAQAHGRSAVFPAPAYCSDNAAMVAGLGYALLLEGKASGLELDAEARA